MERHELGGNIILENFDLDNPEMVIVKKMIGKYAEKIRIISDYDELKLEIKCHEKGHNKRFEIRANLQIGGVVVVSESEGLNPFVLIDEVMKKIIQEAKHKVKKGSK